jgi:hypothetical protein
MSHSLAVYVTVPGQYQTQYVPYSETRNDYVALFFGRLRPGPPGIFYSETSTSSCVNSSSATLVLRSTSS